MELKSYWLFVDCIVIVSRSEKHYLERSFFYSETGGWFKRILLSNGHPLFAQEYK